MTAKVQMAIRLLFFRPIPGGGMQPGENVNANFVGLLNDLCEAAEGNAPSAVAAADIVNELCRGKSLATELAGEIFTALTVNGWLPSAELTANSAFLLRQAAELVAFLPRLHDFVRRTKPENLLPDSAEQLAAMTQVPEDMAAFAAWIAAGDPFAGDPFAGGNSFRICDGKFMPVKLDSIRPANKFYGFPGVRRSFREQFADFAAGKATVPLLVSSLPGHGKTQMIIAHALAQRNLTLILAPAEWLEKPLEELIRSLRFRHDRRFVVFFDDIVPDELDWYTFRTHVGGSFSLPDNVMLAAASNFEFPPSILSRGRSVQFPVFDDVRCMEMIEDFLGVWGFRHPNKNLINLIAARYTEEFGQKRFTELSPRTLMRYLDLFESNQQKRKDMVQLSCGQLITRPDAQFFYDFNIRLMRKLYGNEYIENMLKERLRTMAD